jgi:hypothetical protein
MIGLLRDSKRFKALKFQTRRTQEYLLTKIDSEHGGLLIRDVQIADVIGWHKKWCEDGKRSMGQALFRAARSIFIFGSEYLDDETCVRLSAAIRHKRLVPKPFGSKHKIVNAAQVIAFRKQALVPVRRAGPRGAQMVAFPSMALMTQEYRQM